MPRRPKLDPGTITTIYEKRIAPRYVEGIRNRISRESLRLITNINDDMRDRIGEVLRRGEDEGKSVSATASRLLTTGLDKGVFRSARKRAYLIAKTELHRSRQLAAMDVYREADIGLLKWIGIPDDGRICPACRERHGRTFRTADLEESQLPPIHPRCRCRVVPHDFDIKITPKREHREKVLETKISPTPKAYRYIVKVKPKVKKSMEKAVSYTRTKRGKLEHVRGYGFPSMYEPVHKPVYELYDPQWGRTVVRTDEEILRQELLEDKKFVAKKVGIKPENLTYVGVQPTGEGNRYFHMWNVEAPDHPQHMSSVVGIEREGLIKKSEKKEVRKGFIMNIRKSRKNLVGLRKSKDKGKLIPQNIDGKIHWTKAIGDDLWITIRTRKADVGDTVLLKGGQIAKVTAVGEDGVTARSLSGYKKYQILHENVKLIKAIK